MNQDIGLDDLIFTTATDLARRIRAGEVSATQVLEAHLAQIAQHNPALNAIITLDEEGARRRARAADDALVRGETWGPLHGVPLTVKDGIDTAGLRTTGGFPELQDRVPATDAPVVARLRAAGAVLLGKSNLPVGSTDFQSANPLFGRTNNPWDLARTPGGSSGGAAAAVAAGMTPLELGSDYGGSIRVPAHFCGIAGLKPTQHRVPFAGHVVSPLPGQPQAIRQQGVIGPLARSAQDLDLALRVIAGPDPRDWDVPPVPLAPPAERPLPELHVAWWDDFGGVPVSAATRDALHHLAGDLARHGARVEHRPLEGFDFATALRVHLELAQAEIGASKPLQQEAADAARFGREAGTAFRRYAELLTERDALSARLEHFLAERDVLLCPVASGPAFPHCPTGTPIAVDGRQVPYWDAGIAFTSPFNLTGHPVVALPLARSAEGLPIGVQLVGRRWGEGDLLAIARQIGDVIGPWQRPTGY